MKANAKPRERSACRFSEDERGVSEAVGYIITFGISTVILVTSLQTFTTIRDHTSSLAVDAGLRDVGSQVAFAIEEATRAGSAYTDAKFSMTIDLPRQINDQGFHIEFNSTRIAVIARDAAPARWDPNDEPLDVKGRYYVEFIQRADATILCSQPNPPSIPGGTCLVNSEEGRVTVVYDKPTGMSRGAYFKV